LKARKRRSDALPAVDLIGCGPLLYERIRASLRGSPFRFLATAEPLPPDAADIYVAEAADLGDLPARGVPVIARGPAALMRAAFLAGCDDYLRDPWTPQELELRAQAAISRARRRWRFPWGEASFDGDTLVLPGGRASLTRHEALILRALLRLRGAPVPRTALAYALDGTPRAAAGRAVDVHVSAIRRKVRAVMPAAGRFITCARGLGYLIE
jgi:hypothetical protein